MASKIRIWATVNKINSLFLSFLPSVLFLRSLLHSLPIFISLSPKMFSQCRGHFQKGIQRDSKRWTHFVSLYGSNSKRRLNTRQTAGCGIPSSLLALRVHLRGLRSKLSWIRLTFSSDTRGRPELLPLHRQPTCSNLWFQRQMLFLVGGWMLKRRRNARCTTVADSVLMNSRTQKSYVA